MFDIQCIRRHTNYSFNSLVVLQKSQEKLEELH